DGEAPRRGRRRTRGARRTPSVHLVARRVARRRAEGEGPEVPDEEGRRDGARRRAASGRDEDRRELHAEGVEEDGVAPVLFRTSTSGRHALKPLRAALLLLSLVGAAANAPAGD